MICERREVGMKTKIRVNVVYKNSVISSCNPSFFKITQ